MNKIFEVLHKYYGYNSFRKGQYEIINNILNKRDTFCILPTGGGKSICYQIPALLFNGVTIVITPLIALMKDQVDNLKSNGINAEYINSTQSLNSNLGLNYNSLLGQVNYLKDLLTINNSQDMIVNCGNSSVVLPVNNDNFLSSYGSIYDKMECTCKVIGKVIRVCDENQCIHFLRKTGQAQFYESLLNSYTPLKQILNDKGIFLPNEPKCKVEGKSLLVIPISLFI